MNEEQALHQLELIADVELVYLLTRAKVKSITEALDALDLPNTWEVVLQCNRRVIALEGNLPRERTRSYYCKLPRMPKPHPRDACEKFWSELTDIEFLGHLEGAQTYGEIMQRIPFRSSRYNREFFTERVVALQVDVTHLPSMPPSTIPDDLLQEAVEESTSLTGVLEHLKLPRSKGYREALNEYLDEEGFDMAHFVVPWSKVTKEKMQESFEKHCTVAGIAKYLKCSTEGKIGGTTTKGYFKRLGELGLDHPVLPSETSFESLNVGQRRFKLLRERGHTCEKCGISSHAPNHYAPILMTYVDGNNENTLDENIALVCPNCHRQIKDNGRSFWASYMQKRKSVSPEKIGGFSKLHKLALVDDRGYECDVCDYTEWDGDYLPLNFHHINVNPQDNRDENLQVLCVNCHYVKHDRANTEAALVQKMKERRTVKDKKARGGYNSEGTEKGVKHKKHFHPSGFFTNPR